MIEPAIQRFYRSVEWSWLLELREAERRDGGGDADTIATRLDPDHTRAALHLNRWLRWRGTEDEGQVELGIQRIGLVGEEIHAAGAHGAGETLALRGAGAGSTVRPLARVAPPRGRALLLRHVRGCRRGLQRVRDGVVHVAGAVPHEDQDRDQTDRHQRDNQRVLDHALPRVIAPEPLPEVLHRFLPGPRPEWRQGCS